MKGPSLYELQASWDDERASLRARAMIADVRASHAARWDWTGPALFFYALLALVMVTA